VVLVGLGLLGSQLIEPLARLDRLGRVVLVDRDCYTRDNLANQRVGKLDAERERPKAEVQARYLARLNPALEVRPIVADLTAVPWGCYRADVILGCLDSLAARVSLNQIAWRLGVPWVDGGVAPEERLARVSAWRPSRTAACFECALDEEDYRQMGTRFSCGASGPEAPATRGSFSLGQLTASWMALECEKILAGDDARVPFGREIVLDPGHQRFALTARPRNPRCRFDHATWALQALPGLHPGRTVGQLLAEVRRVWGRRADPRVSVGDRVFVQGLHCRACDRSIERFHLDGRLSRAGRSCPSCGADTMMASGFNTWPALDDRLPRPVQRLTLQRIGLQPGDALCIHGPGMRERHVILDDSL
jgi:molybdopterin/thiamine biosynthesis adenylyltransferase